MQADVSLRPQVRENGRRPPYAAEAEISVLGAMLIDDDAVPSAVDVLNEADFYREPNRRIYRAMLRIFERGDAVDPTTVLEELKQGGELEAVGGYDYLTDLLDVVPTGANIEYYARIVSERAVLRRLIEAQTAGIRECYEPGERSVAEILDAAEQRIMEVGATRTGGRMAGVREAMGPALERMEEAQEAEGGITGVPTGFRDLDRMTGGYQDGNLIVIAGRPSMGKSAIAIGSVLAAAVESKRKAAVASFEMTREEIVHRMLCWEGLVDLGRVLRGGLADEDYVRIQHAAKLVHAAPIWIEDRSRPTVLDVRARCRRLAAEQDGLDLVVVDYIQLMHSGSTENRNQEISEITRGLKALARELQCPVVALSQLSRKLEERADKRPQLSDLRDSGAIEQDADLVLFIYRPEYYAKEKQIEEEGLRGKAELIVGKQRNGPTGTVELFFRATSARFEDITRREKPGW